VGSAAELAALGGFGFFEKVIEALLVVGMGVRLDVIVVLQPPELGL
jgi:hypothetical protein